MKKQVNQNNFADSSAKVLSKVRLPPRLRPAKGNEFPTLAEGSCETAAHVSVTAAPEVFFLPQVTPLSAPASATIDRIFRGIFIEVTMMRRIFSDSLAVVLRPDSRTELFVRLETDADTIQAFVQCECGDPNMLSMHWPELRHSLQQHGVRLMELNQSPRTHPDSVLTSSNLENPSKEDLELAELESKTSLPLPNKRKSAGAVARRVTANDNLLDLWA